eukprot:1946006-Pyramimonas_sp.AAC.1
MAHSQLQGTIPKIGPVVIRVGSRDVLAQYGDARHSLYIEALVAREIGSDNAALRTVLTFVASLPAGGPAMTFGYVPTKKGALQMTSASRLSPKVHLALQYLNRNFFRTENVVSVGLAKRIHELPPVAYADSCTLAQYGNDENPEIHYYEAEGAALDQRDITGSAHSRIIQCLKSTKHQAGFDQYMTSLRNWQMHRHRMELQEKPQKPNRRMMMGGFPRSMRNRVRTSSRMSWKCGTLNYKMKRDCRRQLYQRTFFTVPAQIVPGRGVLITVAEEQRGHLPKWGRPGDS